MAKQKNNACMIDIATLKAAGIDPKTGLPYRIASDTPCVLKDQILRSLMVLDTQNAINRYTWYNLPEGLDSQLVERMLYYKGQVAFFQLEGRFYMLPFALDGTIDVYGRFVDITPLPFNGTSSKEDDEDDPEPWIQGLKRHVIHTVPTEPTLEQFDNGAVILHDFCKQISQLNIPRAQLNYGLVAAMAEAFPMARTSLIANSGIRTWRVNNEQEQSNVKAASRTVLNNALTGDPFLAVVANLDLQDLTNGSALKAQEYLMYMQALDNLRMSQLGIDNGGLFQKNAYVDIAQQGVMGGPTKEIIQDGLTNRQNFCDIVNAVWGLGVWCDVSDSVMLSDRDYDGLPLDEQDQSGLPGQQPAASGGQTDVVQ